MFYKLIIFTVFILLNINKYILLFSKFYQIGGGKNYFNKCFGTINYVKKNNSTIEPKISVVIPIFNCEKTIKLSITSVQNQRLKEIEIILVNDFSTDSSKYIIENIQKNDNRILIINNNKNMGTLYSRNIGALLAKGKYIFALDNDDMFLNDNIILKMYKIAEKYKYDIIGFSTIYLNSYKSKINEMDVEPFIKEKNDKVIFQPNLKFLSITNNDCHIWGKCIKNQIYKNAISLLGVKRSTTYLCYSEDDVIVYMLFVVARTFRYIPTFGIFHFVSRQTASSTLSGNHKVFSKIFFLDLLFDFTDNNFIEKKFVFDFALVLKKFILTKKLKFNKKNIKYLKIVLKKIFNCPYIEEEEKDYLKHIFFK